MLTFPSRFEGTRVNIEKHTCVFHHWTCEEEIKSKKELMLVYLENVGNTSLVPVKSC